ARARLRRIENDRAVRHFVRRGAGRPMSHSLVPVAHVRVVTGQGGGPDKTILRSVKPMRERGYEELCVYLRPPTDAGFNVLERHAQIAGAELMAVDDRGPFDMQVVRRLIQVCRE